ncbi:MAG: DUF1326 domain-containing protein [Pseudohongiella sp.]|nr:DUF1326 domain-containing protein [Pseudohongiella sp.]
MNRREFTLLLGAASVLPALKAGNAVAAETPRWSFVADVAECCSCAIPCPCNFGRPTDKGCLGNRLIQIREGQLEGENLAGIKFLVTFSMGQWTRLYMDAAMTNVQSATLDKLLPLAFTGFHALARIRESVELQISEEGDILRFSTPESSVEMKMMRGLAGAPIVINGLPSNAFFDYVQYESVNHVHNSNEAQWQYSGTNGFVSVMKSTG